MFSLWFLCCENRLQVRVLGKGDQSSQYPMREKTGMVRAEMPKRLDSGCLLKVVLTRTRIMVGSHVRFDNERKGWHQCFWPGQLAKRMELPFKIEVVVVIRLGERGSISVISTHSVESSSAPVTQANGHMDIILKSLSSGEVWLQIQIWNFAAYKWFLKVSDWIRSPRI